MKAVKVRGDGTIKLPKEVLRMFPPASVLAVSRERDGILLKRSTAVKSTRVKKRGVASKMSFDDVGEEIHAIRREKRGPRA